MPIVVRDHILNKDYIDNNIAFSEDEYIDYFTSDSYEFNEFTILGTDFVYENEDSSKGYFLTAIENNGDTDLTDVPITFEVFSYEDNDFHDAKPVMVDTFPISDSVFITLFFGEDDAFAQLKAIDHRDINGDFYKSNYDESADEVEEAIDISYIETATTKLFNNLEDSNFDELPTAIQNYYLNIENTSFAFDDFIRYFTSDYVIYDDFTLLGTDTLPIDSDFNSYYIAAIRNDSDIDAENVQVEVAMTNYTDSANAITNTEFYTIDSIPAGESVFYAIPLDYDDAYPEITNISFE